MTTWLRFFLKNIYAITTNLKVSLNHVVNGSGKYYFAAQAGLVIFCYGATTKPPALFIVLAAVLCALAFRDMYTHHALGAPKEELPAVYQYYVASAADAVTSLVFMLAAQTLALKFAPSLALPLDVLYHGAVFCLPMTAILRLLLRPKPTPDPNFRGSGRSARYIYKRTWALNVLWLLAEYGLICQDVTDDPNSLMDPLRGFCPLFTFMLWILCQRNALNRRNYRVTLFTNVEKQDMERLKETLPQGLKRGEVFYWAARFFEALIFVELGVSMAAGIWPWISGQQSHGGLMQITARVIPFAAAVLTWSYVKEANIDAAAALQQEIDKLAEVYA